MASGRDAGAGQAGQVGLGEVAGHAAGVGPAAPGEGGGGQAVVVAVLGEGVEEGVGGGVVALAGVAEDAGDGGEEHERGQVLVPAVSSCRCQAASTLGRSTRCELVGGQRGEGAVVEDAGGVDDGGERVRGRDGVEQRGQRVAVGDVAGGDGDLGAELGQVGGELGGAVGVGAAAGGEQQVADAVRGDQVAGDEGAEGAGAAGDQHGAVRVEGAGQGEDHLADVPGLAEMPKRLRRLPDVPGGIGSGVSVPSANSRQDREHLRMRSAGGRSRSKAR